MDILILARTLCLAITIRRWPRAFTTEAHLSILHSLNALQSTQASAARRVLDLAEQALPLHQVNGQHANHGALADAVCLKHPGQCLHSKRLSCMPAGKSISLSSVCSR